MTIMRIGYCILAVLSFINLVAFIVDIAQGLSVWYLLMNAFSCVFSATLLVIFYPDIRGQK